MLTLANFFQWLSELCVDLHQWLHKGGTWYDIRERRWNNRTQ